MINCDVFAMSFSMTRSESDAYYVLEKEKGLRLFDYANYSQIIQQKI
jgi:hypothetical protein